MAFTPKEWTNTASTPVSSAGLVDLEERVTDYADSVSSGGTVFTDDDDATILAASYPAGTTIYQMDVDGNVIAIWGQTT